MQRASDKQRPDRRNQRRPIRVYARSVIRPTTRRSRPWRRGLMFSSPSVSLSASFQVAVILRSWSPTTPTWSRSSRPSLALGARRSSKLRLGAPGNEVRDCVRSSPPGTTGSTGRCSMPSRRPSTTHARVRQLSAWTRHRRRWRGRPPLRREPRRHRLQGVARSGSTERPPVPHGRLGGADPVRGRPDVRILGGSTGSNPVGGIRQRGQLGSDQDGLPRRQSGQATSRIHCGTGIGDRSPRSMHTWVSSPSAHSTSPRKNR